MHRHAGRTLRALAPFNVQWPKLVQLVHLLYGKVHHEFRPEQAEPSSGGRSFTSNQLKARGYRSFLAVRIEPAYNRGVWRTVALGQPCRQRDPSMMGNETVG
jgi:hypothetical protein